MKGTDMYNEKSEKIENTKHVGKYIIRISLKAKTQRISFF